MSLGSLDMLWFPMGVREVKRFGLRFGIGVLSWGGGVDLDP